MSKHESQCFIARGAAGEFGPRSGEWEKAPPSAMTGEWGEGLAAKMRDGKLPLNPDLEHNEAEVALASVSRHDGTHLATWELISAITQHAENYASEHLGAWEISPVYVQTDFVWPEGPHERISPLYQEDVAVAYLRRLPVSLGAAAPAR